MTAETTPQKVGAVGFSYNYLSSSNGWMIYLNNRVMTYHHMEPETGVLLLL